MRNDYDVKLKNKQTMEKTIVFPDGVNGSAPALDPNLVMAMNNGGMGGFGGGGWMWLLFLWILSRNGWNGDGSNGQQYFAQALQGNANAISNLSTQLNCSIGQIQEALHQVQAQMQSGFCDVKGAIKDQTVAITSRIDALEKTNLMDKIDALREKNSTLATQLNLEHQNNFTAGVVGQAIAPVTATLNDLSQRLAAIECNQPPVAKIPYIPAAGSYIPVSYSTPVQVSTVGCGCGYGGF